MGFCNFCRWGCSCFIFDDLGGREIRVSVLKEMSKKDLVVEDTIEANRICNRIPQRQTVSAMRLSNLGN